MASPSESEATAAGDHSVSSGGTAAGDSDRKARIDEIFTRAMARRAAKSDQPGAGPGGTDAGAGPAETEPAEGPSEPAPSPPMAEPTAGPERPSSVVLVDGDHQQARYIRRPGTELDLIVMGPCSVEVRTDGAAGTLLYEDDLDAGDSVELPSSGSVWLRVGNPRAVTINADGVAVPIALPARPTQFVLLFDVAQH